MGPLTGIRVVELQGIGPGPFCGMMLSDMGAEVIRIDRADRVGGQDPATPSKDLLARGRRSVAINLKDPDGVDAALRLIDGADAVFEGFRPGVMERLGLGPDVCLARNPKLVYGRITGWGQEGPYAGMAGHDINYIALAGALAPIGRKGQAPVPPLNLIGDFGGGGMLLALGMVAALLEAQRSGTGQVVDAAMVDGASSLITFVHGLLAAGQWIEEPASNLLDTGSHFYDVYETSDGRYVSFGSIEPQFYAEFLELTGLKNQAQPEQMDRDGWAAMKDRVAAIVKTKTRSEWESVMDGSDVCFAPVLQPSEAALHPHAQHRKSFVEVEGVVQPAPSPRFSRTVSAVQGPPAHAGQHSAEVLADAGFSEEEVAALLAGGAVA